MPFIILSILVKLVLVVHIIKTHRNTMWIWVVIIIPIVGPLAYFIVEIWPELNETRTAQEAKHVVGKAINPNKAIREATQNYEFVDTVKNSTVLAEECMDKGMFDEARRLFADCLKGVHQGDPDLMHGLARAEFGLNHFAETRSTLEELASKNPQFKNAEAHLLLAKALEELDETELALREYEALEGYHPGPEASYRHAMLLKRLDDLTESNRLIEEIIRTAKSSSRHYNSTYKVWIRLAHTELHSRQQDQLGQPDATG